MWKANWNETKQRFLQWRQHEGLVSGIWDAPSIGHCVHEDVTPPVMPATIEARY